MQPKASRLKYQTSSHAPCGNGEKILLVDDEPMLTWVFQHLLQRLNYQVVTCNDPQEAVALFRDRSSHFDLVITDLTMPDLNGVAVARQIRDIRPGVPVILASGLNLELDDESLRDAGISGIIEKPVSTSRLALTLKRVLVTHPLKSVSEVRPQIGAAPVQLPRRMLSL